ncbi:MAG: RT0821/Lpp0805 family surface protein [Pseudorhizobium sp.]
MHSIRLHHAVSPILLACLLAGCSTSSGGSGAGTSLVPSRSSSAQYITALQGGIVSRSGVTIGDSDQSRALEAEYRALEAAPGGQPVAWTGRGVSGEVVAAAPYQVGSQNCRQYTHTLVSEGREAKARGAACRNANGTWTPLS